MKANILKRLGERLFQVCSFMHGRERVFTRSVSRGFDDHGRSGVMASEGTT